jgi:hypothetical protein
VKKRRRLAPVGMTSCCIGWRNDPAYADLMALRCDGGWIEIVLGKTRTLENRKGAAPKCRLARGNFRDRNLDGAADVEFAHAGLKRGALHAEDGGGAFGAGDAPFGLAEGAEDVLALGFFERGDGGGSASTG